MLQKHTIINVTAFMAHDIGVSEAYKALPRHLPR